MEVGIVGIDEEIFIVFDDLPDEPQLRSGKSLSKYLADWDDPELGFSIVL
jgi:hypothetical protein